ncbi:hypothetical protein LTR36_000434 [Oleoguttula mirabilis]|uniref:Uncharacterized protein n=1 Tax=Oleoguttula mirabilis TaxID=1507867 RepID=A0AAV9JYX0_9PEZI|nr:hypothetical protein LTR36_000434 [Oleoguttula mirabilis]
MAPSRGLSTAFQQFGSRYIWQTHRARGLATTATLRSGHNRWSKIKHDKGKADAVKNRQRSIFAQEIATASKLGGAELSLNTRLQDLVTKAKREGFAKASIEAAIARGQGRSLSGASLESVTVEGILPNNVAVIVECETDNRLRTLQTVKFVLRDNGGTSTPSSYLFQKRGRIVFEKQDGLDLEQALDAALEAEASDVEEDEDGRLVVSTEPSETKSVGEALASSLGLQIARSEIVWQPNEDTKVGSLSEDAAQDLSGFVDELQEKDATVQAVAMNVAQGSLAAETWKDLQSRLST